MRDCIYTYLEDGYQKFAQGGIHQSTQAADRGRDGSKNQSLNFSQWSTVFDIASI